MATKKKTKKKTAKKTAKKTSEKKTSKIVSAKKSLGNLAEVFQDDRLEDKPAHQPDNIEPLAMQWLKAKAEEEKAKNNRVAVEKLIVDQLGAKEEGSKTHNIGNFKIEIKQPVSRTLDLKKYDELMEGKKQEFHFYKIERKFDKKKFDEIVSVYPKFGVYISDALTVKPGKIGVKVTSKG